jgi:hypothetical protein
MRHTANLMLVLASSATLLYSTSQAAPMTTEELTKHFQINATFEQTNTDGSKFTIKHNEKGEASMLIPASGPGRQPVYSDGSYVIRDNKICYTYVKRNMGKEFCVQAALAKEGFDMYDNKGVNYATRTVVK